MRTRRVRPEEVISADPQLQHRNLNTREEYLAALSEAGLAERHPPATAAASLATQKKGTEVPSSHTPAISRTSEYKRVCSLCTCPQPLTWTEGLEED